MFDSKPVHILYMEDDPGLARLFQKKLEREGYIVDLARDGKEGLAMYATNSYHVVVVDLSMPGRNGMEVIRLMASHGELRPTIMLTGMGNEEIAVKAMKLGACDYVIKDVDGAYLELLPAVVEDCLHKQRLVKEKLWAEKALLESEGRYRNLVETIKELIWEVDVNGVYTYVSPRTHDMYGLKPEKVAGKTPFDLMTSKEAERVAVVFKKIVESQEPFSGLENSILHKDGRLRVLETSGAPFFAPDGILLGYRGTARDITERKEAEERINYLTFHDLLTGLYNRTFFEEEMKRLNTVRKYPVGIIMGDVNKLKFVNDAFGHSEGDELLKRMADILISATRKEDAVARIGGDEFAVILPNINKEAIRSLCDRIITACKNSNREDLFELTVSLGYSVQYGQYKDMQEALKAADDHMYRDKSVSGKAVRENVIKTLMVMLAERDIHREKHSKQLQQLAFSLGKAKGLSERRLEELMLLVVLYDIGKISMSDSILHKPENLTPKEWEIMKRHCETGQRIAKNISELVPVANDILYHHEWWNGKGYPEGLKGKKIPLLARIISIVDAYNAMLNERPYKKAISKKEAVKEIKKGAGAQFDPELVEGFLKIAGAYS